MSPKRGDLVPTPSVRDEWHLRFGHKDAAADWDELCRQAAANVRACVETLRNDPCPRQPTDRQHPLAGSLGHREFGGRSLPQWEYEVTSGGRVRYLVDAAKHTVWLVYASLRHPKDTDR